MSDAGEEAGEARSKQQRKKERKATSITGHASEAVLYACYMRAKYVLYACYMLDFAEAGHWKRALILLLSCARLVRVQNLVIRVGCSQILEILPEAGPGTPGSRPLGEIGCFSTTFLGSDPSKPGIPHR